MISLSIIASLLVITVNAADELTPTVFDRTNNAETYRTEIVNEDFSDYAEDASYSTDKLSVKLDNDGDGVKASATVKKDTDGNQYVRIATKESSVWDVRFAKNFTQTTNSVLFGFDYRACNGSIAFYSGGAGVNGEIQNTGTVLRHKENDVWKIVGNGINPTNNNLPRWVRVQIFIVPTQQLVHFYVDNEYYGSSGYRKAENSLNNLWIGFQGADKTIDIDNITIINMGKADSTWYKFDETEKLTFDYNADNNSDGSIISPLTVIQGQTNTLSSGVINVDGSFKMASTAGTANEKRYQYTLNDKISSRYAKLSFKYKIVSSEGEPQIDMYTNSGKIHSFMIYPTRVSTAFFADSSPLPGYNKGSGVDVVSNVTDSTADENGWHSMEIVFDFEEKTLQYVHDGTVYSTVTYTDKSTNPTTKKVKKIEFRGTASDLSSVWFRFNSTSSENVAYIDDLTFYEDGTEYLAPSIETEFDLDATAQTVTLHEKEASLYTLESIKNEFTVDSSVSVSVTDSDGNGKVSDGDKITFTTDMGVDYVYVVKVIESFEISTEALIVKGTDGQGDDFSHGDTITKAGSAYIELRVKNNEATSISPSVIAAAYDDSGRLVSVDIADSQVIPSGEYKDFELDATIVSGASNAKLNVMIWESIDSQVPLKEVTEYIIDTDDFTVPTVISNNMVLQRNSTATIFGKAPEGATVTATLGDGTTASYTVPMGSNEFFTGLKLGDYNNREQTLTISAIDKNGMDLEPITRTGVLIGDVYYGGGQSNMMRRFSGTADEIGKGMSQQYSAEQKTEFENQYKSLASKLGNVRFFESQIVNNNYSRASQDPETLASKEIWKAVTSDNIGSMYELMIRMAADIVDMSGETEVPIGILCCAQGGTKLTKWISRDALFNTGVFDGTIEITEYENNVTNASAPERWAGTTDLYYDGVRALMPYGVKAAVWYQGESDDSPDYDKYLKVMIDEFRAGMRNDNLPYVVIQLPGYVIGKWTEGVNTATNFAGALAKEVWPQKRLLQWNAGEQLSDVYVVVTNDTGDNTNIHPANKAEISERLARILLNKVNGKTSIACEGAEFKEITAKGAGTITFTTTKNIAVYEADKITDYCLFEVSSDGKTWYEIDKDSLAYGDEITVNGNSVTVATSQTTEKINYVRYAYTPAVVKCLYTSYTDGAGSVNLPLVPFDTTYIGNVLN